MNILDTIAGVVIGGYLIAVATKGNAGDLITLAKRDKAFLAWGIALGILVYLYSVPELKGIMAIIIFMAFVGLFMVAGDNIIQQGKTFWASFGETK